MKQLSQQTIDLLDILQEECAETIQAISKIKRFGVDSFHPEDPFRLPNIQHLVAELGDVVGMTDMLMNTELGQMDLNWDTISEAANRKKAKIKWHMNK